jgi:large subunit ribosomal protein L23
MAEKKYTFEVDVKTSKTEIKDAVEAIFGVKVDKVNTLISKPKAKRVRRHAGYTARRKKAVVTLTADSKELDYLGSSELCRKGGNSRWELKSINRPLTVVVI